MTLDSERFQRQGPAPHLTFMLIDTHAHLDFPEFAGELPEILERARAAGVERVITISTSIEGCRHSLALADEFAGVFAAVGVHPGNASEAPEELAGPLREAAAHPRVVAIGECGLDYHRLPSAKMHESAVATAALGNETPADLEASVRDGAVKARQASVFEQQLDLAAELQLPVVIHERDAWEDVMALLEPYNGRVRGVFHCFGRSIEQAREALDRGHLLSFTGILTFKNADLVRETLRQLPAGSFMAETDCPYLAPAPFRGKRCEPAHTRETVARIAEIRGLTPDEIAAETTATAERFFRFVR